jgi:hypothetical protein
MIDAPAFNWAEMSGDRHCQSILTEEHARRIGKQILRDNALALFPQLKARLWKGKTTALRTQHDE